MTLVTFNNYSNSQILISNDVWTPKGSTVVAWEVVGELSDSARYSLDSIAINDYPNATPISLYGNYYSTVKFNCHGYAWHRVEGGSDRWIGAGDPYDTNPEYEYWEDESYIEISSPTYPGKLNWSNGDHSAVTTSQTGVVISKWRDGPLMRHTPNDSPYGSSGIKYYKLSPPTISSTSSGTLCNYIQRTFSESSFTNIDLDYDWGFTTPLDEVSVDDKSTYTVEGTSQNGQGMVSLTVTTPSGATATANKNVWVGAPIISSIDGLQSTPNNQWAYYTAQLESSLSAPTDYNWILNPLNGNSFHDYGVYCDIAFYNSGDYQLVVQAKNTCSDPIFGPYSVIWIYVYDTYYMMISPNPTSGEATLSIESGSPEDATLKSASTTTTFDETAEWDLEVYDNVQNLKLKKTKLKGKSTTIQTQSWKEGVYVVRVKYKDEILTGKLVVKK